MPSGYLLLCWLWIGINPTFITLCGFVPTCFEFHEILIGLPSHLKNYRILLSYEARNQDCLLSRR